MSTLKDRIVVTIRKNGTAEFIHDDSLMPLTKAGVAHITRASHVEPGNTYKSQNPLGWYCDMEPVGGPVLDNGGTGFDSRKEALAAEVDWLHRYYL